MGTPSYGDGGTITYNFAAISDVATAIGSFEGAMDGALQELYSSFQQLFANDWHGAAGQACEEAQRKWSQGAAEIKAALGQVGVKLGASADRMQEIDRQIASQM
jgi:WXG100 family type VII secretion target